MEVKALEAIGYTGTHQPRIKLCLARERTKCRMIALQSVCRKIFFTSKFTHPNAR